MRFGAWAAVWQCPRWSVLSAAAVGPPHPCRNPSRKPSASKAVLVAELSHGPTTNLGTRSLNECQ
uniref:Secreted protein n=1 Tax=Anguilla anguilla TaxID=7936 RepID=A0A0E9TKT9_ANGAN